MFRRVLSADAAVCVAAVSDWRTSNPSDHKMKKGETGTPTLNFIENMDILATLSKLDSAKRPSLVVGFAAETENVLEHAQAKINRKGCDWIVANDVSHGTGIMGGDDNQVHIISASQSETWQRASKQEVARQIANKIAKDLK